MFSFFKKKTAQTGLSRFIREADSREKKRTYLDVLRGATERQNRLMAK